MTKPEQPAKMHPTRILLVDDHPVVRDGLAENINRENGLTVCAQAEDQQGALKAMESASPHLVVIDLMLKNSSGMELIRDIHARWPQVLILVVSMHDEMLYAERVLRAGAKGYITKQEATQKIVEAIRRLLSGGIYLSERISSTILGRLSSKPPVLHKSIAELLTERELEVFELTGQGLSTREIALQLHINMKTVDTYRGRIKDKLELEDSSGLLKLAIQWNREH